MAPKVVALVVTIVYILVFTSAFLSAGMPLLGVLLVNVCAGVLIFSTIGRA